MDTILTVWGVYQQRWGGVRCEEGAFNNQQGHEAATEGSRGGGRFGGIWDTAVDDSSMAAWYEDDGYVGGEQRAARQIWA